jgi:hypothetical protein
LVLPEFACGHALVNQVIVESLVLPAFACGYALVNQVIVESLVLPASRVVMLW